MLTKIKQIFEIATGKELSFNDGNLIVENDGISKSWHVKLTGEESEKYFDRIYTNDEESELKFVSADDKVFCGSAIVTRITSEEFGTSIELQGNGRLIGYDQ